MKSISMRHLYLACLIAVGCSFSPLKSNKSETSETPHPAGSIAHPTGQIPGPSASNSPGSCSDIETAETKLRQTFYPLSPDLSCSQDSDCVVGQPDQHIGTGDIMNRTAAQIRDAGEKAYQASAELQSLQDSYKSMNCIHPVGVLPMPIVLSASCVKNICKGNPVSSCNYSVKNQATPLQYCLQYSGLSATDNTNANTACTQENVGSVASNWNNNMACATANLVGKCIYAATGSDPIFLIYYYSPGYSTDTAQTACKQGDGKHTNGVWQN